MQKKLLKINNYSLTYNTQKILDDVSIEVMQGDFIIIAGHNGSGKSTLFNIINKNIHSEQNKIFLDDIDITKISNNDYLKCVTTINQDANTNLFGTFTIYENFQMHSKKFKCISKDEIQSILFLYNKNLSGKLDTVVSRLSGGEKQSLSLALSLLSSPKLLLLDEHTSALDPKIGKEIMNITASTIKKHRITCMMITHNIDDALKYGNKIYAMQDGKICYYSEKDGKLSRDELIKYCY